MLKLDALGAFGLRDPDGLVAGTLTQPKRAALLAYLALARPRGFHRRDTLLGLFWPELDDAHARNALSQALSFLRRGLPDGVLATRGPDEVGVDPRRLTSDVVAFEAAVEAGQLEEALTLYRGELLAGLHLGDAPGFERWLDAERDRLRESASRAAWSLADERLEAGEPVEAERAAQRALLLSPTDESPVRRFVEALTRAGDRAAALRFYEKFRTLLAEELEVEPAHETAAVAEAVRRGELRAGELRSGDRDTAPTDRPRAAAARTGPAGAGRAGETTRRRHGRGMPGWAWAFVFVVLGLAVVGAARWLDGGREAAETLIGEGRASRYDRIVVADLESHFDPGLGRTAAEWLRTELDQSDIVRPVGPDAIGAALRRMQRDPSLPLDASTAREIAVRDGYPLIVVGEMEDVGETCLVLVQLESAEGEVLGRYQGSSETAAELVRELDRIGGEIRDRIGEARRAVPLPPLEQVTTASLDALRLYTDAVRIISWEGRSLNAIPLLERAIGIDSTFAFAYLALSRAMEDVPDWDRRDALARKAYQHRDRLTDYERLMVEQAHHLTTVQEAPTRPPDECDLYQPLVRMFESYVRRHPDDVRPLATYADYLERVGRPQSALAVYGRALERRPADEEARFHRLVALARRGRFEEAEALLDGWPERVGMGEGLLVAEMSVPARTGAHALLDSLYTLHQEQYGPDPVTYVAQGRLDALRGRMADAWEHYHNGSSDLERRGLRLGLAEPLVSRAFIRLVVLGDTAALDPVESWLRRLPADTALAAEWVDIGILRALARDGVGARAALDMLVATNRGEWSLVRGPLRAAIALAEGRPIDALAALESSASPCSFAYTQLRADPRLRRILAGRAYEALGRRTDAIGAYQAYLDDPPLAYPIGLDAIFLFDTLERLARLHDQLGHGDEAIAYYARAADLWADADPELQPRVRALRERAGVLVDERRGRRAGGAMGNDRHQH